MGLLPFEYAARNLGRNPARTLFTVGGAAAVVFLVLLMGAFLQTLGATLQRSGEPRNVIVLGLGSEDFIEQSSIGAQVPSVLAASVPEIEKAGGVPLVSPEIHHATTVRLAGEEAGPAGSPRKAVIRGVSEMAFLVHP